jgi:hypothetical protein
MNILSWIVKELGFVPQEHFPPDMIIKGNQFGVRSKFEFQKILGLSHMSVNLMGS